MSVEDLKADGDTFESLRERIGDLRDDIAELEVECDTLDDAATAAFTLLARLVYAPGDVAARRDAAALLASARVYGAAGPQVAAAEFEAVLC